MNSKKLLLGMFAAVALAGCSSDDAVENGNGTMTGDGTQRYLTVNIMSTSAVTRADKSAATYEDGSEAENAVDGVRFYFFTSDGNAAKVKK